MKKILILAGAVLLFVLLLTAWLFITDFSYFAETLGEGAKEIALDEKSKFIGTWETTYIEGDDRFVGYSGIYKLFSDKTGSIGGLSCTWDIVNDKLVIHYNLDTYKIDDKKFYRSFSTNSNLACLLESIKELRVISTNPIIINIIERMLFGIDRNIKKNANTGII